MTNNMSKAIEARKAKVAAGHRIKLNNPIEKWQMDVTSLRKSINAKCFDCSNRQIEEVRHCTVTTCPLWFVRPYQEKS
jgi:hypothetical protein